MCQAPCWVLGFKPRRKVSTNLKMHVLTTRIDFLKNHHRIMIVSIDSEYSLGRLMLMLKLQHFGHLKQGANSLEKTLMMGKIEGMKRRGQQRMRWLDAIIDPVD